MVLLVVVFFFVVQAIKQWPQAENRRKYKPRKQPECSVSVFYTDKGRNVGMCHQDIMGEAFLLAVIMIENCLNTKSRIISEL